MSTPPNDAVLDAVVRRFDERSLPCDEAGNLRRRRAGGAAAEYVRASYLLPDRPLDRLRS